MMAKNIFYNIEYMRLCGVIRVIDILSRNLFILVHQVVDKNLYSTYKKVMKNQWKTYDEWKEEQEKPLRYFINLYRNVPYYHKFSGELKLSPYHIRKNASHNIGQHTIQNKVELVHKHEKYGRVLITSEGKLGDGLEKYQIKVSPEKMHDLLYYASLYVGEGATMATESAILVTPAIYISSLVGTMGNFVELEEKYGLIFNYSSSDKVLDKAIELIQQKNLKQQWNTKRDVLLGDKIDVTSFMVQFIEKYSNRFL